jgi:hypothetical protein
MSMNGWFFRMQGELEAVQARKRDGRRDGRPTTWIGYCDSGHLLLGPPRERYLRCSLPYGKYTCRSGRELLFNRGYRPIWERVEGVTTLANYDEWVSGIERRDYFFNDGNPPWARRSTLVL